MNKSANYKFTIIVPVYNEEDNIYALEKRIGEFLPDSIYPACVLFVNDGSKEAVKEYMGMQPGDVYRTYADTSHLEIDFGYKPQTTIQKGIENFYNWYVKYSN